MTDLPAAAAGAVQPVSGQPGSAASEPLPLPAAAASMLGPHPQNALLEAAVLQSLLQTCRLSPF